MRYSKDENAYILAEFVSGDTVTIDIYRLSDDVKVVDGVNVSEVSSTGTFKYLLDIVVTEKTEFLLIMIFYKADNTVLATFNLLSSTGTATYKNVFERVPV